MPKVVASVINAVLGLFGAKPIPPWGSIVALPKRMEIVGRRDSVPAYCAGKSSWFCSQKLINQVRHFTETGQSDRQGAEAKA